MTLLEVEGARARVPHSWRRHWRCAECSLRWPATPETATQQSVRYLVLCCAVYRPVHCHVELPYLPSRTASPPFDQYQIILLGDRGTELWPTCPKLLCSGTRLEIVPTTSQLQVRWPAATATPQIFTRRKSHTNFWLVLEVATSSGDLEWLWTTPWPLFCFTAPNSVDLEPITSQWLKLDQYYMQEKCSQN